MPILRKYPLTYLGVKAHKRSNGWWGGSVYIYRDIHICKKRNDKMLIAVDNNR